MSMLTIAIPTYNSSIYLKECIKGFIKSEFVNEIIIGDDSSNSSELLEIKRIIDEVNIFFPFDIKLFENSENTGAFLNKYSLISKAKNHWVYQIDSDNVPDNIDKAFKEIINSKNPKAIYYPSKIIQFRKYKYIAKFLAKFNKKYRVIFSKETLVFDTNTAKKAIEENIRYEQKKVNSANKNEYPELKSLFVNEKHIFWVLNSGNFITNKSQFLDFTKDGLEYDRSLLSLDAVAISYLWFKNGGEIQLQQELKHFHRKRYDSVSFTEKESSKLSREFFTNKFLDLI